MANQAVPKAKLFKMVSFKGVDKNKLASTDFGGLVKAQNSGFQQMGKALNSIGASVNSLATTVESMNQSFKESINSQIKNQDRIQTAQDRAADRLADREKRENREKIKDQNRAEDAAAEDAAEKPNLAAKLGYTAGFVTGKIANGMMAFLSRLGGLFLKLVGFKMLDWMAKNPEKIQKIVDTIGRIGKFIFNAATWLAGFTLGGLSDFMENPISLKGILGFGKFLLGLAVVFAPGAMAKLGLGLIFKGGKALLKPAMLLLKNVGKLIWSMGKVAAKGIFKTGKFLMKNPKAALIAGGVALGAWGVSKLMNREEGEPDVDESDTMEGEMEELDLSAFGLTPGQMPDDDQLAGINQQREMAGQPLLTKEQVQASALDIKAQVEKDSAEGTKKLKQGGKGPIAKAFDFIMKPILGMWDQIKNIFGKVTGFFREQFEGFMGFFGELFTKVGGFLKPYIDKLKGLGKAYLDMLLAPFFKMFDAVKRVMEVFKGKEGEDKKNEKELENKMFGGRVIAAAMAAGGWINGPQSGYAVSMDGTGIDFIGHGLEYVARKSAGGFVVPFDTPATRKDPGLTSRRLAEAAAGGFKLPGFEAGGAFGFAKEMIKVHEGLRLKKYTDSEGHLTIGYGHLVRANESMPDQISKATADKLFDQDFEHHKNAATKIPGFDKASAMQKAALIDLTFNMGPSWYREFPKFVKAFQAGNFDKAADELVDSQWYKQVKRRGPTIVDLIRGKGNNASYLKDLKPPTQATDKGEKITQSQRRQDERVESSTKKGAGISTAVETLPPITAGGGDEDPGPPLLIEQPKKKQAAADYMIPRFGLMQEITTPSALLS